MRSAIQTVAATLTAIALIPSLSANANAGPGRSPGGFVVAQSRPSVPFRSHYNLRPQPHINWKNIVHFCNGPDLALTRIEFHFIHVYDPHEGRHHVEYTIQAVVKNVGHRDWKSGANQQQVNLDIRHHGRTIHMSEHNHYPQFLRVGGSGTVFLDGPVTFSWSGKLRLFDSYHAFLVYDPDIDNDGNTANDDCNPQNQSIAVSRQRLRQAILRRQAYVIFRR